MNYSLYFLNGAQQIPATIYFVIVGSLNALRNNDVWEGYLKLN